MTAVNKLERSAVATMIGISRDEESRTGAGSFSVIRLQRVEHFFHTN